MKPTKRYIEELDLFDNFVGILPNGQAVSKIEGVEMIWSYNIPVDEYKDKNLHVHMTYAMLAATIKADGGRDANKIPIVHINIVPRIGLPTTITARSVAVNHPLVKQLEGIFEEIEKQKKVTKLPKPDKPIKLPKHDGVTMEPEGSKVIEFKKPGGQE